MLLSCVRANSRAQLGFVDDWRRLNVSITRAKASMVVVGHARTLSHGQRGEAMSDLVRAAAAARAIYAADGSVAATRIDEAHCRERETHLPPRRPAPPPGVTARPVSCSNVPAPAERPQLAKRARERTDRGHLDDGSDGPEEYLRKRIGELEEYAAACRQAEALRAEARQVMLQRAAAPFAPPRSYAGVPASPD